MGETFQRLARNSKQNGKTITIRDKMPWLLDHPLAQSYEEQFRIVLGGADTDKFNQ